VAPKNGARSWLVLEAVGADPPLVKYCTLRAKEGPQSACQRKPLHCAVHREDHPEVTLWRVQSAYAVQLRNPVEGDHDSGAKPISDSGLKAISNRPRAEWVIGFSGMFSTGV